MTSAGKLTGSIRECPTLTQTDYERNQTARMMGFKKHFSKSEFQKKQLTKNDAPRLTINPTTLAMIRHKPLDSGPQVQATRTARSETTTSALTLLPNKQGAECLASPVGLREKTSKRTDLRAGYVCPKCQTQEAGACSDRIFFFLLRNEALD